MKNLKFKLAIFIVIILTQFSCSNDDSVATPILPVAVAGTYMGSFVSSAHPTSGTIAIPSNKTTLNFSNFISDNGPDLNIYLVKNLATAATDFIDLGDIKGLNGNYTYNLTHNIDLETYKYVVVWCVDFNVNFGYALVTKSN